MNNFIINIYGGTVHINKGATEGVQNVYNCEDQGHIVQDLSEDDYEELENNKLENKYKL